MSEILSNNIEYLIDQHGIKNPSELAKVTKIPQPTIYRWMQKDDREPRPSSLRPLADYFNVNLIDLLEHDLTTDQRTPLPSLVTARREVPITGSDETRPALIVQTHTKMFAVRVERDDMQFTLPVGSIVLVDPTKEVLGIGEVAYLIDPVSGAKTFRKVLFSDSLWWLKNENLSYGNTMHLEQRPTILGRAVEVQTVSLL
jgi:SOS-response transcriptional repressor LexA